MTATTTERLDTYSGEFPHKGTFPMGAGIKILKGTIVCLDSNSRAALPIAPGTAGIVALGIAAATYDNTNGADDAMDCQVEYGVSKCKMVQTTPVTGQIAFVVDNQTVSTTETDGVADRGKAGVVSEVRDGHAFVYFNPIAMALTSFA